MTCCCDGSRPSSGSSRMRRRGLPMSACAMSSRWRSPPDMAASGRRARSTALTICQRLVDLPRGRRAPREREAGPLAVERGDEEIAAGKRRGRRAWCGPAAGSRRRHCRASPARRERRSSRTTAGASPRRARNSVVLPAPLAPSTPTNSPSPTAREMSSRTSAAAERQRDAVEARGRVCRGHEEPFSSARAVASRVSSCHAANVLPSGSVSVTATTGTPALLGDIGKAARERVLDLGVVEEDLGLAGAERLLDRRDIARRRFGLVHDRRLEIRIQHGDAERLGHVAEHRLGGDGRRAGEAGAEIRDAERDRRQAAAR